MVAGFRVNIPPGFGDVGLSNLDEAGKEFREVRQQRRRLELEERRTDIAEQQVEERGEVRGLQRSRQRLDARIINLNEAEFLKKQVLEESTQVAEGRAMKAVNQFTQDEDFVAYGQRLLPLTAFSGTSSLINTLETEYNKVQAERRDIAEEVRKREAKKAEKVRNLATLMEGVTDEEQQTLIRKLVAAQDEDLSTADLQELGLLKGKPEKPEEKLIDFTIGDQTFKVKESEAFKHAAAKELAGFRLGEAARIAKEKETRKAAAPPKPDPVLARQQFNIRQESRNLSQNLINQIPGFIESKTGFAEDDAFVEDLDRLGDIDPAEAQYVRVRSEWAIRIGAGEQSIGGAPIGELTGVGQRNLVNFVDQVRRRINRNPRQKNQIKAQAIRNTKTDEGRKLLQRDNINPDVFRIRVEGL